MVTIYAVGDDQFIDANELQQLIESNENKLAAALGYSIISVESSKPTEVPMVTTATTVTDSIPDWAIALIVIVNSVLAILLLLIVLAILWKCYTQ